MLGNEPRSYREAMARALRARRPGIVAEEVDPDALDRAITDRRPTLVVCSALTGVIERLAPSWVLLYPDGARLAVSSIDGTRTTAADLDLDSLLALTDQMESALTV